jgi:hypothetical protein
MYPFRRKDLVKTFCRKNGNWLIIGREGDRYELCSNDHRAVRYLTVRHQPKIHYIKFSSALPLQFPLDRTPSGLFARMLLRNLELHYCHWNMDLGGSYEARPFLCAQWPVLGMTKTFFESVCREMTEESHGFLQELRDKFQGAGTPAGGYQGAAAPQAPDVRYREPDPDIRFADPGPVIRHTGPVPQSVSHEIRARMLEDRTRRPHG